MRPSVTGRNCGLLAYTRYLVLAIYITCIVRVEHGKNKSLVNKEGKSSSSSRAVAVATTATAAVVAAVAAAAVAAAMAQRGDDNADAAAAAAAGSGVLLRKKYAPPQPPSPPPHGVRGAVDPYPFLLRPTLGACGLVAAGCCTFRLTRLCLPERPGT